MFSITFKRSAATLGVVAGLLAAAAPASAQILDGPLMWDAPNTGPKAPASAMWAWHEAARTGLAAAGPTEIYDHGITQADDRPTESVSFLKAAGTETGNPELKIGGAEAAGFVKAPTAGTQIGSEGVKAPTTPTANGFIIDFAHTDVKAPSNAGPAGKTMADDSWELMEF